MKKCVECKERIARYWKNLDKANFCYECFKEIMVDEYRIRKARGANEFK